MRSNTFDALFFTIASVIIAMPSSRKRVTCRLFLLCPRSLVLFQCRLIGIPHLLGYGMTLGLLLFYKGCICLRTGGLDDLEVLGGRHLKVDLMLGLPLFPRTPSRSIVSCA